jgi:hypothetical protein
MNLEKDMHKINVKNLDELKGAKKLGWMQVAVDDDMETRTRLEIQEYLRSTAKSFDYTTNAWLFK